MGEGNNGNEGDEKEHNYYKDTLASCRDTTIPNAKDAVYDGDGSPLDAISNPISSGGWECTEADNWLTDLGERCKDLLGPFDDAVTEVSGKYSSEPDEVPKDDYRGSNWPRTWSQQRRMAQY